MIPRFRPIMAAWVRSLAPSLERMFRTWPLTVSSLIESCAAISLLAFPSAISRRTRDFRRGQRVIGGMLGKLEGDLRGHRLFPGMDARIVSSSSLCKLFFSR